MRPLYPLAGAAGRQGAVDGESAWGRVGWDAARRGWSRPGGTDRHEPRHGATVNA